MKVLGLSCYYHDSAAALVVDGKIVAAGAEERFSRRKHDNAFPAGAIASCLQIGGLPAADLDAVAYYEKPIRKFDRILVSALGGFPRTGAGFVQAIPKSWKLNLRIDGAIRRHFGKALRAQVYYGEHHRSHAASAYYPSGFDSAAVLTLDGVGEWATATVGRGEGNRLELLEEIRFPHSLGLFYSALTAYLGFEVNEGEWKVMGLA
ncbi:MAG: hypothetical protein HY608_07725, partial [Planctomycetes bacterium]|nr:hypothetical protein [Planctomycetota bacterium]